MSDRPPQSETHRPHRSRTTQARWHLAGVTALLFLSYTALLRPFSLEPTSGVLASLIAGCTIASALLLGAVWKRQSWARIVLVLQLLLPVGFLGIHLFIYLVADPRWTTDVGWRSACLGILGLIGTIAWLKLSRRIRYFTSPDGRRTAK